MKKLTVALATVLTGLLLSMPAFAFGPGYEAGRGGGGPGLEMSRGGGPGYHHNGIWEKLNLSRNQKAKMEELRIAHRKEIRPIREKMFDKSVELRRMWLQVDPNKDKIMALQKEVRELRDQLEDKDIAYNLEIRKVLTPQQREKLADSGWDRGIGYGPRGGLRGHGEPGPGIGY